MGVARRAHGGLDRLGAGVTAAEGGADEELHVSYQSVPWRSIREA
ncbi:hypothetical protein AB0M38_31360 [Streptomyces sp. NPDC051742]